MIIAISINIIPIIFSVLVESLKTNIPTSVAVSGSDAARIDAVPASILKIPYVKTVFAITLHVRHRPIVHKIRIGFCDTSLIACETLANGNIKIVPKTNFYAQHPEINDV